MNYTVKLDFAVESHTNTVAAVLPAYAEQLLREWLQVAQKESVFQVAFVQFKKIDPTTILVSNKTYTAYSLEFSVTINGINDFLIRATMLQAIPVQARREDYELFALISRTVEAV